MKEKVKSENGVKIDTIGNFRRYGKSEKLYKAWLVTPI
jgi:hypothetical protein